MLPFRDWSGKSRGVASGNCETWTEMISATVGSRYWMDIDPPGTVFTRRYFGWSIADSMRVSDAESVLEDKPALISALGSDRKEKRRHFPSPLRYDSSIILTIIPSLGKPGPYIQSLERESERSLFELSARNLICSPLLRYIFGVAYYWQRHIEMTYRKRRK